MGGDSGSEGGVFKFQHRKLDEHFFTFICCMQRHSIKAAGCGSVDVSLTREHSLASQGEVSLYG